MRSYRLYCLKNGRFYRCEEYKAEDDEAAILKARTLQDGMAAELWQEARLVTSFQRPK